MKSAWRDQEEKNQADLAVFKAILPGLIDRQEPVYPKPKKARKKVARMDRAWAPVTPGWLYSRVSARADADYRLSSTARRMLSLIARWARGRGECEAFIGQVADALGVSTRMVQYAQNVLSDPTINYLTIERRRAARAKGGRGSLNDANIYRLTSLALPSDPPAQRTPRARSDGRRGLRGGERNFTPRGIKKDPSPLPPPRGRGDRCAAGRGASVAPEMRDGSPPGLGSPSVEAQNLSQPDLETWLAEHPPPNSS